jgi:polysaccharide deacetylase family protein (PEP-CTERM system associated)
MDDKVNILQIDVEDWYCDLDFKDWKSHEDRIAKSINKVLTLLKERNIKATFFILGYIAERFPQLVKRIKEEGHEIASHGYNHTPLTQRTPQEFERDLSKSINILEEISNDKIWGYRASQFTLVEKTSWLIDILKKKGLRYDSSIFPVKLPVYSIYGVADAPLFPYRISSSNIKENSAKEEFLEFPLSVYKIPIINKTIPIAGGFYLRLFPYWLISHAIKKINKAGYPAVCYLHPWELDPGQPRIKSLKWYHYYRLGSTEKKFKRLLRDFKFISTRKWIENNYGK